MSIGGLFSLVQQILFDRRYFFHLVALLLAGEAVLGLLIIHKVPCELHLPCFPHDEAWPFEEQLTKADTKIDWDAYMQQVELFRAGEMDYSRLVGETGPCV